MKKYLILLLLLFFGQPVNADDVDIYGVSTINVKPNVLIIFDNSGSMSENDMPVDVYDPLVNYSGHYTSNNVYKKTWSYSRRSGWSYSWEYFFSSIDTNSKWQCSTAKVSLIADGYYAGDLSRTRSGYVNCDTGDVQEYRLGNYINFDNSGNAYERRMVVAKTVIAKLIYDNSANVNFGVMKFHYDEGGFIVKGCGATQAELIGNYNPATTIFTDSNQSYSFGAIGGMYHQGWTPLAETMAEAGLYFAGKKGWFNNTTYTSPIDYRCQKNYIILVTDGEPTRDGHYISATTYLNNKKIPALGHDGDGTYGSGLPSYLDDVSHFLANEDLRSDLGSAGDFEDQNITTFTIGMLGTKSVSGSLDFLKQVATNGNGQFYPATSAATLGEALNNIITNIGAQNEQFSSAAVPVNSDDGFTAGNYVYFGLFQPLNTGGWAGNLKKYALSNGVIKDANDNDALLGNGKFSDNAISFWSSTADGNTVTAGGAGEQINGVLPDRNIYTYTGTNNPLTDTSNLFVPTNTVLTGGTFSGLTTEVISAVRHDGTNPTWPMGSLIHSEPLIVHYSSTQSMIYVGANDGMLHCIDDEDGSEQWGYIPNDLLGNLSVLEAPTGLHYFVDGSPTLYSYDETGETHRILIFGERRGGYSYSALDVSNPLLPRYKYSINPGFLTEGLGQSWGKPQRCKISSVASSTTTDHFLLSGGYDTNQDSLTPTATDTIGRAVYAIDSKTGTLSTSLNFNNSNFSSMTHSIVAATAFENPLSRVVSRVYAGDMNGNMFAFRDDDYCNVDDTSCVAAANGVWQQRLKLFSSPGKKIFYPPNITNEYFWVKYPFTGTRSDPPHLKRVAGDYVFYGTGDRAHPTRTDIVNDFYSIKNSWQWEDTITGAATETPTIIRAYVDKTDGKIKTVGTTAEINTDDLFILDVTDDLYQNTEADSATQSRYSNYIKNAIGKLNNRGWYFRLEEISGAQLGEKVVSTPIIFAGYVIFTTYIPDADTGTTSSDPCANPGASGTGYLYTLDYKYGGAVLKFSTSNPGSEEVLERKDRRLKLKTTGVPPEPRIITSAKGDPFLIIGKQKIALPPAKSMESFYWQQLD